MEDSNSQTTVQLTFGEKLVGLTFNPSNDDKVSKAKRLCAELADLLYDDGQSQETTNLKSILEKNAYCEILNAQMNVVKVLTLKYWFFDGFGNANQKAKQHPTEKPLELMKWIVSTYSNEGELVLDNTMGVGTTCLGAKELNRSFIGIEKEVKYYDLAVARVFG
jgi:DNA modification methylase